MKDKQAEISVLVVDACQYSPNYNYCLMDMLTKGGEKIIYATTVYPYGEVPIPPGIKVWYCFYYLARIANRVTSSHFMRRVLRAIEHPINTLTLVVYVIHKRIRLVHYMWIPLPTIDLFAIRILKWAGCQVICTAHEPLPIKFKARDIKQFSRIYGEVDHIIALTNFSRNEIVKYCKISPEKISVIAHGDYGYIFSHYPCNEFIADKVRQAAAGRYIITFLGLIRPYKGLEYFIKAVSFIKSRRPDTFFLIAGSTRFTSRQQIEHLLEQNCDQGSIYTDFNFIPTSDLKAYLSVTDVLVQPYIRASQSGNTVMAYSAGIPVVCTDVGGLAEMVEDGRSGYIVPPKDPQAIADAVVRCFEGDNLKRMSSIARSLAAGKYSWQTIATQTARVYHRFDDAMKKS